MKNKKIIYSLFAFIMMLFGITVVSAASTGTIGYSGVNKADTGATFTQDVYIGNISGTGKLMGVGGTVTVTDSSCLSFTSIATVDPSSDANGTKFSYLSMTGTNANTTLVRVTFTAGSSACSTTINIVAPTLSFTDGTNLKPATVSKTITVAAPAAPKSSDASLKSLVPSTGSLSPAFASGTATYSMTVENEISSISFTATPNDSKASVQSGTTCSLSVGSNACKIVVKAEDGSTRTYTVNVTRKAASTDPEPGNTDPEPGNTDPEPGNTDPVPSKSGDNSLKSLDISGFTLYPSFNKNTTTYAITVANNITALDVDAIPNDEKASVQIVGNYGWKEGSNPVKIIVTAEDGSTKTYIINVTRSSSSTVPGDGGIKKIDDGSASNNYLKSLTVSNGELKPEFNKNTSNYNVTIGNQETKLDLSAIPEADTSKVTIVGNDSLKVGVNTITVEVTAKDGSLRIYTLNVTRSEKDSNAKLKEINIKGGYSLEPKFSPDTYEYNLTVGDVNELDISAITQNPKAKVEITGNKNLKEGNNVVILKVTDENGFTQYYRVNVEKKSGEKKFLGLTLKGWLILLGILLILGLLLFLILLLLNRKKKEDKTVNNIKETQAPVIEFKPEFNFGSKNGTDDDIVHEGGVLNQYSGVAPDQVKEIPEADAKVKTSRKSRTKDVDEEEVPYDPYDDIVTKDEIIDALEEARETDDDSKLKMLYAQELLNRKKEEIKAKDTKKQKRIK